MRILGEIFKEYRSLKRKYPVKKTGLVRFTRGQKKIRSMQANSWNEGGEATSKTEPAVTTSRRLRLLGLARATRDNYLPRLSLIASGIYSRGVQDYGENGNQVKLPDEANIHLFRTYTTKLEDNQYRTDISGWVCCPGVMTRKNRLLLSLAKQITRYGENLSDVSAVSYKDEDLGEGSESVSSSDSSILRPDGSGSLGASISGSSRASGLEERKVSNDDMIRKRLSNFMAQSVPNTEIMVELKRSDTKDNAGTEGKTVFTDSNGHFNDTVVTRYKPTLIYTRSVTNEDIEASRSTLIVPPDGLGIVSDIDDTVKNTGVTCDKRDLMKNLLLNDVCKWKISPVVSWYCNISSQSELISFHYVSNSPWQLFSVTEEYFDDVGLPDGSIQLKQYNGSIFSSLMEPSNSRKKQALKKLADDFPNKKFICIGDSGEFDLEAYVDLALNFPSKVLAIYIRHVNHSLSYVDEKKILHEIIRTIERTSTNCKSDQDNSSSSNLLEDYNLIDLSDDGNFIKQDQTNINRPPVPKKPDFLRSSSLGENVNLTKKGDYGVHLSLEELDDMTPLDTLARTNHEDVIGESLPPLPPRRSKPRLETSKVHSERFNYKPQSNGFYDQLKDTYDNVNYSELVNTDRKGLDWLIRVENALRALKATGTDLRFFSDDDPDFFDSTIENIKNYVKKQK